MLGAKKKYIHAGRTHSLGVFAVTPSKNPQKQNRNHSMTNAKNFKCYKRLINKQLLQVSGLCGTPFFSYLPKRSTQIYRAQYGDAMLVPTLRARLKAAGNQ